jgi:hypothetical protein
MLLLVSLLLSANLSQAQTMEARGNKVAMLARIDRMQEAISVGRNEFNLIKLAEGCAQVKALTDLSERHLRGILAHMDFSRRRVQRARDESINLLRVTVLMDNQCQSRDFGQVDPDVMENSLKRMVRTLRNHKRLIERESTSFHNSYYYRYEF